MIEYKEGNLFDTDAQVLVNTVNTVGVMGKGIALQFKKNFPDNFKLYKKACETEQIKIGELFLTEEESLVFGKKIILNFPTKTDWKKPSEYDYIEQGLKDLVKLISEKKFTSVAIPPLGSGQGGLEWKKVKSIMEKYLKNLNCKIIIYEPDTLIKEILKSERVKLTPARAMLLNVLFDLVRNEEFVSEFAAEKVSYFLQRLGAKEQFKLNFTQNFYGPYSGKVRHVLSILNGSYISGFSSMDKKAFDDLQLNFDAEMDIINFLNKSENLKFLKIANKTKSFLTGFYSNFALELLSTIDYIKTEKKIFNLDEIKSYIENWSDRKKMLFAKPKFIEIAFKKLTELES